MKFGTISLVFLLSLVACTTSKENDHTYQIRIDSLEKRLAKAYTPGLGEFMTGIQIHHGKLWFAGQNQNWRLADFEVSELQEALLGIKQYCAKRIEVKNIAMMDPPMDSISKAIQQKDFLRFRRSYILLTTTCNNCHQVTSHEFNVIKTPAAPPFSNQDFKLK